MNFMSKPVSLFSVHIPIFEHYLLFALLKQGTHESQNPHIIFEEVKKNNVLLRDTFF